MKKPAAGIILITLFSVVFSKSPKTSVYSFHLAILSFLALLVWAYLVKKKGRQLEKDGVFLYLLTFFILFTVASTGWFFSPFFFLLYLLAIILAFVASTLTSIVFIAVLSGFFLLTVAEVDLVYDLLVVFSYLTVIPLILYLKSKLKIETP